MSLPEETFSPQFKARNSQNKSNFRYFVGKSKKNENHSFN